MPMSNHDDIDTLSTRLGVMLEAAVDHAFGDQNVCYGFLLFPSQEPGPCTYISNADKVQLIAALQKLIADLRADVAGLPRPSTQL